ncbi:MAG TPA: Ig-like domain-containing protein [Vicinamibacterales bacterium]|nr:Ig-like domain-containing protein [Vicinamibacterales bacterium]
MKLLLLPVILSLAIFGTACSGKDTPTAPTPPVSPAPPPTPTPTPPPTVTVTSVAVTGTSAFTAIGATAQLRAIATLSNGTTEDRTSSATWRTDNEVVATVSSTGVLTVRAPGDTAVTATVSDVRGSLGVSVRLVNRTPDPPAGLRIALPDVREFLQQSAAARPDLLAQSCPTGLKYQTNPWLDYMVDRLRTLDTRWGYNGKPNRSASDNGGQPVVAAGDEIAYHYGPGPDQGSPDVYLIDILEGHCGPTPRLTYRNFTGEEPGFWTGAGRLR